MSMRTSKRNPPPLRRRRGLSAGVHIGAGPGPSEKLNVGVGRMLY
jgi:hypothetical protein